jgi:hypothetical protein
MNEENECCSGVRMLKKDSRKYLEDGFKKEKNKKGTKKHNARAYKYD